MSSCTPLWSFALQWHTIRHGLFVPLDAHSSRIRDSTAPVDAPRHRRLDHRRTAVCQPAEPAAALPSADRVPLFVITTADGSTPLFTDADGTRASFFAERRDAEAKLKSLKGAGDAVVMSLPLSEALDLKKQPASELGGEFLLSARKGERDDAGHRGRGPTPTTALVLRPAPRRAVRRGPRLFPQKAGGRFPGQGRGRQASAKAATRLTSTTSARALEGENRAARFIIAEGN